MVRQDQARKTHQIHATVPMNNRVAAIREESRKGVQQCMVTHVHSSLVEDLPPPPHVTHNDNVRRPRDPTAQLVRPGPKRSAKSKKANKIRIRECRLRGEATVAATTAAAAAAEAVAHAHAA